jgi:hypothetical protein
MPQPTPNAVHVDAPLSMISVAYLQDQTHFVATQVFPVIPVEKQSDKYFVYTKNDWFRDEAQPRAPASESAGSGYNLDSSNRYSCDVFAIHKDVDNQTLNNSDIPLNPLRDATQFVTQRMLVRQEVQWAADYFTTSVWGNDVTPTNLWSDYTLSDPISDVETGKATILQNTGFMPNTLVIGYNVWKILHNHPDIVARINGGATTTQPAILTQQQIAAILEVDKIVIARAVYATNKEGETSAMAFTHGKHALLCYVNTSPSVLMPSAGYTFMWRGVSEGLGTNIGIKQFPMIHLDSQRVEAQIAFDNKVIASDLGYFFNSVVA